MDLEVAQQARYVSLQKWEGSVLEIHADSIIARLVDLTGETVESEAEILLDEISEDDRALLRSGAVFHWNIGYRDYGGRRERVSSIRFLSAGGQRDLFSRKE